MPSGRTSLFVLVFFAVASAVVPIGSHAAGAQDRATERETLEKRKTDLDNEIDAIDRSNADLERIIAARTGDVRNATAQLEVIGDEFSRTHGARKIPARNRVLIAIDPYERVYRKVE